MFHIEHVDAKVRHLTEELYQVTAKIKADLQTNAVKTAEAYAATIVPEIDPLYKAILAFVDTALKACQMLKDFDWDGVESRLARLISNIVAVKHGNKTRLGKICTEVQIVVDFLIGKGDDMPEVE